eukprot:286576_1
MDCLAFDGVQVQTWTPIKDIKCLNPEVSQPVPFPNLDASQWYVVSADRTRLGPFDNTQILQKVHNGEILDTTLLCNGVTVTQWAELQNIESLMNALGTTKGNDEGERTKQWYVRDVDKQRQGPLDEHGLLALYDKGKIDDNSLIYEKDRTKEWQKLKRSKSDPVAASLVSVILEVDDIAHKHFMNEMIAKRTQIYEQRLHKQQIKQHRERIKSEQMEQDEAVITIKREPKDPHSLHERAAKKARKWRAKLGEMQEVSGRGIKTQDQRKECLDCFQSNTTMNRIERICKAIDEFEPSDYKLLLKVETLIHRYFANNRNLSSKGDRMNINKKTEHLQEEQPQLEEEESKTETLQNDNDNEENVSNQAQEEKKVKKAKWWISDLSKQKLGPMSWKELRKVYTNSDEVTPNCYIWHSEYVTKWTKIKQMPKLLSKLETTTSEVQRTEDASNGAKNEEISNVSKEQAKQEDVDEVIQWHVIDVNKKRRGPLLPDQLIELKNAKLIKPSSLVWNGKTVKTWTAVKNVNIL